MSFIIIVFTVSLCQTPVDTSRDSHKQDNQAQRQLLEMVSYVVPVMTRVMILPRESTEAPPTTRSHAFRVLGQ
jgi:hypothetical protein